METVTHLQLSTHPSPFPPTHSHPLPSSHPLIQATYDIIVTVKKVAQYPAVLAT